MPRTRPGRVRTKRTNGQPPLRLSTMDPHDFNVRAGETRSIACPDCRTWRRIMGDTVLKVREHCTSHALAEDEQHVRCPGSNRVVLIDIDVTAWQRTVGRHLRDGMWADQRRAARQHYKPLPEPAAPIARMKQRRQSAAEALTAYRRHFKACPGCAGRDRCPIGARLAALYEQLQRTQALHDRARENQAAQERRHAAQVRQSRAVAWDIIPSGIHEQNNTCRPLTSTIA